MIFGLICILALVVILAFFIGKNLDNTTAIWFFKNFENKNVIIIVFIAFAAGIIFSLICFMIGKIIKEGQAVEPQKKTHADKKIEKEREKRAKEAAAEKAAQEKKLAKLEKAEKKAKSEKINQEPEAKSVIEAIQNNEGQNTELKANNSDKNK